MLAGVGPFAIEAGLVPAQDGMTPVRIFNVNTGAEIEAKIQTPGGGSVTMATPPSRRARHGCADPADVPELCRGQDGSSAPDRGRARGDRWHRGLARGQRHADDAARWPQSRVESLPAAIAAVGPALFARTEPLRLEAGRRMGLGDVATSVVPKVGLLFPDENATIAVAYLTPWALHQSLAVTGGICIATAVCAHGTIAESLASPVDGEVVIAHRRA